MDPRQNTHDPRVSLLAADAAARQAMLERMRGKLAGRSRDTVDRRSGRKAARKGALAWGWRLCLAALFLGANAFIVSGFKDDIRQAVSKARTAPEVRHPRSLAVNEQALYWAYALYDFDKLKKRFGAPAHAVVDAAEARRQLALLLPRVDARTRFQIDRYLPRRGTGA